MLDANANIVWQSEYTPYGKVAGAQGIIAFSGMFAGQDIDPDTRLTYHWNRWRSEDGSRFMSEDPAQDGINYYAYVGNNPLSRIDPTGHEWEEPENGVGGTSPFHYWKKAIMVASPFINITTSDAFVLVVVPVLPKVTPLPETTVQFTKLYPPEGEAEIEVGFP